MPYIIKEVDGGFKVCKKNKPSKCFSSNPLTKIKAKKQIKAIGLSEKMYGNGISKDILVDKEKLILNIDKNNNNFQKIIIHITFTKDAKNKEESVIENENKCKKILKKILKELKMKNLELIDKLKSIRSESLKDRDDKNNYIKNRIGINNETNIIDEYYNMPTFTNDENVELTENLYIIYHNYINIVKDTNAKKYNMNKEEKIVSENTDYFYELMSKNFNIKINKNTKYIWFPNRIEGREKGFESKDNIWISSDTKKHKYPIYIISYNRYETRLTSNYLDWCNINYNIVIRPEQEELYKKYMPENKHKDILLLTDEYLYKNGTKEYLDQGGIPARNFCLDHSIRNGHKKHWILDDNIDGWKRLYKNKRQYIKGESIFTVIEDYCDRYENIMMAGHQYAMFAISSGMHPITKNTRIFSSILINNEIINIKTYPLNDNFEVKSLDKTEPVRWRGKYNEDVDLSLQILSAVDKNGNPMYSTVLFNSILANKMGTMTVKGGNDMIYTDNKETNYNLSVSHINKAESLLKAWTKPNTFISSIDKKGNINKDIFIKNNYQYIDDRIQPKITYKFNRPHHSLSFLKFKDNPFIWKTSKIKDFYGKNGYVLNKALRNNNYGMQLKNITEDDFRKTYTELNKELQGGNKNIPILDDNIDIFLNDYKKIDHSIDINKAKKIINDYYQKSEYSKKMLKKWYKSLYNKKPDYSIYKDKYYFTDIYYCWKKYSSKYLNQINSIKNKFKNVNVVLDVGNGIGYSTIKLKEIFKNAIVYGLNLKNSYQYKFNELNSKKYDYKLISNINELNKVDLIFASEFFEHIENPIEYLLNLLKMKPKYLIIANSFNTYSIGHFNTYIVDGKKIDQTKISRIFNDTLKKHNYLYMNTGFWNNKPQVWVIKEELKGKSKPKNPELYNEVKEKILDIDKYNIKATNTGMGKDKFVKQLENLEFPVDTYLQIAKNIAAKEGYDPTKLSLANNNDNKLKYESPEGIKYFGKAGYGDYIIWSFKEQKGIVKKGYSDIKRNVFRKSHGEITKIHKLGKYSPNELAIKILW